MSDRVWRIAADVTVRGEWFVEADSAEEALEMFDNGIFDDEPENHLRPTDYELVGTPYETDEYGFAIVATSSNSVRDSDG